MSPDAHTIRAQTTALCEEMEGHLTEFEQGKLPFNELRTLYDDNYRSRARALAEAMLYYVPDSDPRLMMVSHVGDLRTFKSDDVSIIEAPISEGVASVHLHMVLRKLLDLTRYLPDTVSS